MAIQDEIKEQQRKTADMAWKGKVAYFWDYYKIHTGVIVIALLLLVFFVKDIMTGNQESVFQMAIINSETQTLNEKYEQEFGEYLGIDFQKEAVTFDNTYQINMEGTDQLTVASSQKMVANVQLALIDAILAPADIINYYAENFFLSDLSMVLPKKQFDQLDAKGLIYYVVTEEGKCPIGIRAEDSWWIKETGLYIKQQPIVTCLSNTKQQENFSKFVTYIERDLLEEEQ